MPSPFDFAQEPVPGTELVSVEDIIRSYINLNKTLPQQQEDEIVIGLKFSPLIDVHDIFIEAGSAFDVEAFEFDDHQASEIGYRKVIPNLVHSDPLIYDFTNFTNAIFNIPNNDEGTRFLGGGFSDGSSYITVDNNVDLSPTDEIICVTWAFVKINSTLKRFINKDASTSYSLDMNASNQAEFKINVNAGTITLTSATLTEGWHHIVGTAKSGVQSLYIDDVLVDSATVIGAIGTDSNDVGLFATATGANNLAAGEGLAWVSVINGFADSAWVSDDFIGIRDISDMDEFICFPFMADERAQTIMTSGLFISDT